MEIIIAISALCAVHTGTIQEAKPIEDKCKADLILCMRKAPKQSQYNLETCYLTQPQRFLNEKVERQIEEINKARALRGEPSLEEEYKNRSGKAE